MIGDIRVCRGRNDLLTAQDGRQYIDLIAGYGAVLLGHCRESTLERLNRQIHELWLPGKLAVPIVEEAKALVDSMLPTGRRVVQFYSSGNEAAEFAIRLAAAATGRAGFVGFDRSMHGKSLAASAMCWTNANVQLNGFHTLDFISTNSEDNILRDLREKLATREIAAVFVELIQATSGGFEASAEFYKSVCDSCREFGTLCVVDEVLTGFYRTGVCSYATELGLDADVLLFGKAMGNGFPVAAVVCREDVEISPAMLPGSGKSRSPVRSSWTTGTSRCSRDTASSTASRSARPRAASATTPTSRSTKSRRSRPG